MSQSAVTYYLLTFLFRPYYVYLFSDLIIYAQRRKKGPHKYHDIGCWRTRNFDNDRYVTHKYLVNSLFIDFADSSKGRFIVVL